MSSFKELTAFSRLPLVTIDRGVVLRPGYDEATGVFTVFDTDIVDDLDLAPDRGAMLEALRTVWRPWSSYKWASYDDRAGMFSGILLAMARSGMDIAPGLLFDAPTQGSGKTLAGQALGALVLDRRCPTTPFAGIDEAELRKCMVANAIDGYPLFLLDNVTGHFDSAVLAGLITSGRLRDRILGASINFDGPARLLCMMTSNNASLSRDLTRRFVRCRIDHGVESPQALAFPFSPAQRALDERMSIIRGLVTVFAGFFAAGAPRLAQGGDFPEWHALVRSCVFWLRREGLDVESGIGELGDPAMLSREQAGRDDPESVGLGLLLHGLRGVFGSGFFQARDVVAVLGRSGDDVTLVREALEMLYPAGVRSGFSAVAIGRLLGYRRDRISDGLALRSVPGPKKTTEFSIQNA